MTTEPMVTFNGDPAIKAQYRAQLQAHYDADQIIQGRYWARGKGCAVGCLVHSKNHRLFPKLFGIPEPIAWLLDGIFERLDNDKAKDFPLQFWDAVPVGADLSMVVPKFLHWLLVDPKDGVLKYASTDKQRAAVQHVAALYVRVIAGNEVERAEWEHAADAADAAVAAYVARAVAVYAACAAAAVAVYADYAAAAYAVDAAAASRAAGINARIAQRDKLIALIQETAS